MTVQRYVDPLEGGRAHVARSVRQALPFHVKLDGHSFSSVDGTSTDRFAKWPRAGGREVIAVRCVAAFDAMSGRIINFRGLRIEMTRQLDSSTDHGPEAAVIHIIDDDKAVREAVGDLLRSMGYSAVEYQSASEFLDVERVDRAGCIVLDVHLPGTSGLELQDFLARSGNHLPVILMTGFGDIQMSEKGMQAGAVGFLTKPFRAQDMFDAVSTALDHNTKER